jgi:serine/threonine-protein kinase
MTPEGWQRVKEVFDAAANLQGSERVACLDEACRGDEELRREVESLLSSDEDPKSFIVMRHLNKTGS